MKTVKENVYYEVSYKHPWYPERKRTRILEPDLYHELQQMVEEGKTNIVLRKYTETLVVEDLSVKDYLHE